MNNLYTNRRGFLKLASKTVLTGLLAGSGLTGYSTKLEPAWMDTPEVPLTLPRLAASFEGLRLVQLSDIHIGGWMNRYRLDQAVRTALSLKPDIIALTGDYLIGHVDEWHENYPQLLFDLAESLRPLSQAAPLVAVLGNHDHWAGAKSVRAMLASAGAIDLSNSVHTIQRGSDRLHLAGIDSYYEHKDRLNSVLRMLPDDGAAILLAHEPDFADISAPTGRFDLQISGHSHGGQVVIPFFQPPVLPKYGKKYPSGLYQVGGMYQYTNRGIGMAQLAVRFNCRPEITAFVFSARSW